MQKNKLGIAMIEVLISMGIISLILLSLLIYQISMIKESYQLNLKTIATIQLMNFADMLLVNISDSRRNSVLDAWNNDNANLLPQGEGDYNVIDDHQCKITLNWFSGKQETKSIVVFC
jgi:Tfp pilus assembly protein PilV